MIDKTQLIKAFFSYRNEPIDYTMKSFNRLLTDSYTLLIVATATGEILYDSTTGYISNAVEWKNGYRYCI